MRTNVYTSIIIKCTIVFLWMMIVFSFLYLPKMFEYWKDKNSLNIATWTDMLDEDMIKKFEQETGISINISYFDNNDELLVKMRATKGEGYDLIIPSDHTVQLLIKEGLLRPLDKEKITIWDRLHPRVMHAYFDPENNYSLPYYWGIYGIGIDKNFFKGVTPEASWDLIFKPLSFGAKVSMYDNPREAILVTAVALFNDINNLEAQKLEQIKQLLIKQKKWVEAYTEFRADYLLLSGTCPVVATTTPLMFRLMSIKKNVEFLVPKEGTFIVTDNWVIPQASSKEDLTYKFINFLYQPETIEHHFNVFTFIPATIDLEKLLADHSSIYAAYTNTSHRLLYFENVLSKDVLNAIWIALKAS